MAKCEQLILFSDMEGCLALNNKIQQHTLLCDSATFNAIYAFLETSTNHVAFCGDYFDAGPKIAESIIGMAWLKESFPNQVHIILGNRDINKMRLKYEKILVGNASLGEITKLENTSIYETWSKSWITPLTTEALKAKKGESVVPYPYDPIDRVDLLLAKTFGAPNLLSNLVSELKITKAAALTLFDTIFTGLTHGSVIPTGMSPNTQPAINAATFVTACKNIFFHGKLIEIITVGTKQVLLSHAGSSHIAIYTKDYSTEIQNAMASSESKQLPLGDYFVALETYRANLECTDAGTTTNGKITYNVDSLLPIETVIDNINKLKDKAYNDILSVVQVTGPSVQVSQAWLLVQAMGIPATSGNKVATPIQSCILTPMCMSPIEELSPKITAYFSSSESKVDIIAHGHIPSCVTVPIIARITSAIIFVALDQSNGNRPSVSDMTLQNVPIACIAEKTIGIVSLNANGTLNNAETSSSEGYLIYAYQNGLEENDPDYYRDLVKTHNYVEDTIPTISTINNYINSSNPIKFQPMLRYDTNHKHMIRANEVRRDSDTPKEITSRIIRERDEPLKDYDEGRKGEKTWKNPSGVDMVDGGNKNKSKNKRLRKCRKCLMCCNGSCDYSAKLNNTKRGSRKQKKARKTIKKSNNAKQRTRKQKKARKHKK